MTLPSTRVDVRRFIRSSYRMPTAQVVRGLPKAVLEEAAVTASRLRGLKSILPVSCPLGSFLPSFLSIALNFELELPIARSGRHIHYYINVPT